MHPLVEPMLPSLMGQARTLAWRYHQRAPHALDRDELESVAISGLMTAATQWESYCAKNKFSPDAVHYFGAYAGRRMRGAILDYMRGNDWLTRSQRARAKELDEAGQGAGATEAELAERTGLSITQIRSVSQALAARPVSFEAEQAGHAEEVVESQNVEGEVLAATILKAVTDTVESLNEEGKVCMALRFYQGLDVPEIADLTGISLDDVESLLAESAVRVHEAMLGAVRE